MINKVDVLLEFFDDDLKENCGLEEPTKELLKIYHFLTIGFISKIKNYNLEFSY